MSNPLTRPVPSQIRPAPSQNRPAPSQIREVVSLIAGEAVAALGALILGEYEFAGATPFIAGVLFGLAVAEMMITVAKVGTRRMAVWAAVMGGGGILLAAWISSGRGIAPMPRMGYVAAGLAAIVAGGWMLAPSRRSAPLASADPPR